MKKCFWMPHFTPDCGANETVPPASNQQFLQYKLNGIQLLMYVLFISIVSFTLQYSFMHYAQFFQELDWVLALSVSLCHTLRYIAHIYMILMTKMNIFESKNLQIFWVNWTNTPHTYKYQKYIFEYSLPSFFAFTNVNGSSVPGIWYTNLLPG